MADTTYTDNVTVITADTMNDLNRLHYTILGDPATGAAASWKLITDLTADATPAIADDYVVTSDASASTGKKVLLKNLFVGTGNLGIGIANPSYKLVVSDGGQKGFEFAPTESTALLQVYNRSTLAYESLQISAETIRFNTGASPGEVVRIDSNGKVGIGTTSPSYALHVARSSGNQSVGMTNSGATGADTASFYTAAATTSAQVTSYGDGNAYFVASAATALVYGNSANGPVLLNQNNTERMRVDANGYLLVGYTSSNGAHPLQVNGQIFATNATISTSDGRYKQNVQPITGALDIVSALRPVSFRWKKHPIHDFDLDSEQLGFIAQEVGETLDRAGFKNGIVKSNRVVAARGDRGVRGEALNRDVDEEFLGLAEGKIVPLLAAAIKELKAEFDAYKAAHP